MSPASAYAIAIHHPQRTSQMMLRISLMIVSYPREPLPTHQRRDATSPVASGRERWRGERIARTSGQGWPKWSAKAALKVLSRANRPDSEVVYRRELRPVIATGAEVMDKIFSG
jgi:hypothetical protein